MEKVNMSLKDNLLLRIKNQVSSIESIKNSDSLIMLCIKQADEIIAKAKVNEVVREDIAYYRLLLMIEQNDINESHYKMYEQNIQIVKDAKIKEQSKKDKKHFVSKVQCRRIF